MLLNAPGVDVRKAKRYHIRFEYRFIGGEYLNLTGGADVVYEVTLIAYTTRQKCQFGQLLHS